MNLNEALNTFFSLLMLAMAANSLYPVLSKNEYQRLIENYGEEAAKKRKKILLVCAILLVTFSIGLLLLTF